MVKNTYIFQCLVMTPRKMLLGDVRLQAQEHQMHTFHTLSRHDCTSAKLVLFEDIGAFKKSKLKRKSEKTNKEAESQLISVLELVAGVVCRLYPPIVLLYVSGKDGC
jgi:hypothetical protein